MKQKNRMRYPERSPFETRRQRAQRLALQRAAQRAPEAQVQPEQGVAFLKPSGELVMPFVTFKRGDYGQLCQMLGLSPSRPRAAAA